MTTRVRSGGVAHRDPSTGPFPAPDRAAGRAGATPRRLRFALVALVALGLATGIAAVTSVQNRSGYVDELTTQGGPLVVAAQDLYRSLSDADATAAAAFLAEGAEPPELRERYQLDIANASAALARASSGVNDGPAAAAVSVLATQLPIYTGLVETARTQNRLGLPVGAAYLREASGIMREKLLPAARQLFDAVSAQRNDSRESAAQFPVFATLLSVLLLGGLVLVQLFIARRTNRLFNVGLLVASAAALAAVLWLTLASVSAANHLEASDEDGSAQVELLSHARIAALQARSDEAHTLVARGAGAAYEEEFQQRFVELLGGAEASGLLGEAGERATDERSRAAVAAATDAAGQWQEIHTEVRERDDGGDYPDAVALAIGSGEGEAGGAFNQLDEALADGIAYGSERFDREADGAGGALSGVGIGIGLLTAVLLLGVAIGVQQRLAEYR